jgi:predicted ester cyclase
MSAAINGTWGVEMSVAEMKTFIRNHFDQFVNGKNPDIADTIFASDFIDHGTDVPAGTARGPAGAKEHVGNTRKRFPDMKATIEDIIAEGDKVVVRNVWRATDPATGNKIQFGGIAIWRIDRGRIAERWAYLESPSCI